MKVIDLKIIIESLKDECDILLQVVGDDGQIMDFEDHPVIEVHYSDGGQALYVSSYK
jgi:hypothetical protein